MSQAKKRKLHVLGKVIGGMCVTSIFVVGLFLLAPHQRAISQIVRAIPSRVEHAAQTTGGRAFVVDGSLDTDEVDIASKLPGRLAEVRVAEGDRVQAGQIVAVVAADELGAKHEQATAAMQGAGEQVVQGQLAVDLERRKAEDQVAQANAGVQAAEAAAGMARAKLIALEKGARPQEITQAVQAVAAAQATYDTASKTYQRVKGLADEGVVAQQKADEAEMASRNAEAQLTAANAKLSLIKEGARVEEIQAAQEQLRQAEAGITAAQNGLKLAQDARLMVSIRQKDVDAAREKRAAGAGAVHEVEAYQRQLQISSPIAGIVSQRMSRGGEIIAPGYAIMTIARTSGYWVDVYVDEDKFAGHHLGEPVQVDIPALGAVAPGKISRILPAADFASKRATNEKGSFDVRSVHLRIVLKDNPPSDLASGMTARVRFSGTGGH